MCSIELFVLDIFNAPLCVVSRETVYYFSLYLRFVIMLYWF